MCMRIYIYNFTITPKPDCFWAFGGEFPDPITNGKVAMKLAQGKSMSPVINVINLNLCQGEVDVQKMVL